MITTNIIKMLNFVKKIFGSSSKRQINSYTKIVNKINELEKKIEKISDQDLKNKTQYFKNILQNGSSLDEILPEVFSVVREVSKRTIGLRHFDVQLVGGIVLHQGMIAEMKTGEGKTLVATLAAYLNALSGDHVHIVTVNDYLALRDSQWMGKIYEFLGLTVGCIISSTDYEDRVHQYNCDIIYATNNEIGFDTCHGGDFHCFYWDGQVRTYKYVKENIEGLARQVIDKILPTN